MHMVKTEVNCSLLKSLTFNPLRPQALFQLPLLWKLQNMWVCLEKSVFTPSL